MNTLIVIRTLQLGGMERVAVNLSDSFAQAGHDSHLLYLKQSKDQIFPIDKSVHLHYFSYNKKLRSTGIGLLIELASRLLLNPLIRKSHFIWVGFLGGWLFKRHIQKLEKIHGKFDQIIFRGQGTLELVWNWYDPRIKFVVENIISDNGTGWKQKLFSKAIFHRRHLVAVSSGVAESINAAQKRLGWKARSVSIISNPCPVEEIRQQAEQKDPDIPNEPYILNVARLVPQKDHALLLNAYKQARIAEKLVIVGDGRLRKELEQLAVKLEISDQVYFAGSRKNPYPWMKHARCLVLSSKFEGLGIVLLESLACGTPILSVDCPGGVRDVFKGELAIYLTERNEDGLSNGIRKIVSENQFQIKEQWLDDFRPEVIVKKYLQLENDNK